MIIISVLRKDLLRGWIVINDFAIKSRSNFYNLMTVINTTVASAVSIEVCYLASLGATAVCGIKT